MRISIPREVKTRESRVAITPSGVDALVRRGHEVLVQRGAGVEAGHCDEAYLGAGARLVGRPDDAWSGDLVLKVKEPVAEEYGYLRGDLTLFTYLHLATDRILTERLIHSGTTAIAYETVQLPDRSLPLLKPMSEVAGRLAPMVGGFHLLRPSGGRGMLLGGVPGAPKARVVVVGGGVAGEHAAANALGMQADVTLIDISVPRLRELEVRFQGRIQTRASSPYEIAAQLSDADLVIGAALIPGAKTPKLVTDEMVAGMKPGSVLVDIAIDQGGCFEGSRPTTHDDPTFQVHESLYYCVTNMPGAVPETSTTALTNATLPYVLALADQGPEAAMAANAALAAGLNTHGGEVTNKGVAEALGLPHVPWQSID